MKRLFILIALFLSFGIVAQSQTNGQLNAKQELRLKKHPNKALKASPVKTSGQEFSDTEKMIQSSDSPTLSNSALRKKARVMKSTSKKANVQATHGLNPALLEASKVRPQKVAVPQNQTTSKVAEKITHFESTTNNNKNVTILSQDFDTWPVSGWLMYSGTSSTASAIGQWHQGFGSSGDTLNDFAPQVHYDNGAMSDEWLVSPAMSLPTSSTIELEFEWQGSYHWHVDPYDGADNPILISTNGGSTWQTAPLWQEDNSTQVTASGVPWPWTSFTWYTSVVDLSSYAGQSNVKIAFRYVGNDGAQWQFDNVEVYTVTGTAVIGDVCSNAYPITGTLPLTGSGTGIQGYSEDYASSLTTPYGYGGPDMVYAFTPTTTGLVEISFAADYDNLIAVFTNCASVSSSQVAAQDTNWTVPYTETFELSVSAGTTYYIVNAAYDATATGNWTYSISAATPCVDNLIPMGISEVEPNGGINETPTQYDPRSVGTVTSPTLISGTYYTIGDSVRDMDWFNFTLTQEMEIVATVDVACTDPVIFILSDTFVVDSTGALVPLYFFSANDFGAEMGESLSTSALPVGDYWLVVAPATFAGISTPVGYNATLAGIPSSTTPLGDVCGNPFLASGALPITGSGIAIENYNDDYSTAVVTPYGYNGADVIYEYTATSNDDILISFACDFDNVIAVFTDCTDPANSTVAAMDNNVSAPFAESLTLTATTGTTYYILNAAYDAAATGNWDYSIELDVPCIDNLVPVGTAETEPNGGTNETPTQFDPRPVGTTLMPTQITGTYFTVGDSVRDMDWFNFTLTQEMIITATVDVACTDPIIFIISDSTVYNSTTNSYDFLYFFSADNNGVSTGETLVTTALPAGDYWFVVAPNTFAGIDVPVGYNATLGGESTGSTQVYYFEDFQNGMPTNMTLYNLDGLTPNSNVAWATDAWNIVENPDLAGDSIAVSNSWYTPAGTANDWIVTPAISIGATAMLEWDIKAQDPTYPDGYEVRISTTGPTTASLNTVLYSTPSALPTWETLSVNLTALGYANQTIWIAFRNNSSDQYLLFLDDIKVYAPNTTDVAISDATFTPYMNYSIVPLSQAGFSFGATANNVGSGALSNITFSVDALGTSYSETATISSLAVGASTQAAITNPFVPTSTGQYDFFFEMNVAGDPIVSNNQALETLEISDTIMARDNGTVVSGVGFTGITGHFGNIFEVVNTTDLSSVSVYFNSAETWETFSFTVFDNYNYATNTVGLPIATSQVFTKTTTMAGQWNTFEMPNISLTSGNYLVAINQLDTTNIALGYDGDPDGHLIYYLNSPDSLNLETGFGFNSIRVNMESAGPAPNWNYTITSTNHSILVPLGIPISIDGVPIVAGDYLGVFYDQNGVEACGGYLQYTGNTEALTAWGAESQIDNGFQAGENFVWKIWRASTQTEHNATPIYNTVSFPNEGTYVANGMSGLSSLIALTIETQTLNLPSGWSIFSTYINPFLPNLNDVFNPIINEVSIVKNGTGLVFWPQWGLNAIGDLAIGQGYQIKLNSAQTLDINGLSLDPLTTNINLPSGWSIIGYLHQIPANIETMLSTIASDIIIVKSGYGQVYWPSWGLNAIGNMIPGQGYQINLTTAHVFSYPAITGGTAKMESSHNPTHFTINLNTGSNMTILFPADSWNQTLEIGDELAAFDQAGTMVGSAVYNGGHTALSVWGVDELENNSRGMITNKPIEFRVWDRSENIEIDFSVVQWQSGNNNFAKDGISIAGSSQLEGANSLLQNHPNPFSNETTIEFILDENAPITIELYNILGNRIDVLYTGEGIEGKNTITFEATGFSSGTYFYRLQSDIYTATRSLTIQR